MGVCCTCVYGLPGSEPEWARALGWGASMRLLISDAGRGSVVHTIASPTDPTLPLARGVLHQENQGAVSPVTAPWPALSAPDQAGPSLHGAPAPLPHPRQHARARPSHGCLLRWPACARGSTEIYSKRMSSEVRHSPSHPASQPSSRRGFQHISILNPHFFRGLPWLLAGARLRLYRSLQRGS